MVSGAGEAELAQLLLRYRGALAVAAVYLEAGFDAIVEDVIIGPVLSEFLALVPVPELHLVFLDPDATALADRDTTGRRPPTATSGGTFMNCAACCAGTPAGSACGSTRRG